MPDDGDADDLGIELVTAASVRAMHVGPLFVQDWRGTPMPHDHRQIGDALEDLIARYPRGISSLGLIRMREPIGSPDAEVREEAKRQFARADPHTVVNAIVIDASGFGGRTMRAFMAALLLVARPKAPTRVFAELDPALAWMKSIDPRLTAQPNLDATITQWWT